ncbi:hypothetical protein JZ785_22990 [Alicyclobacillus curvatus]|nr:hypothetical protein JZ785_22990 [Alicyclobacillus curvatus]
MDSDMEKSTSHSSDAAMDTFGAFARNNGVTMDMGDVQFANLSEGTLNQIRKLEHSLRRETQQDIYLLAYEKPNNSPIPRH